MLGCISIFLVLIGLLTFGRSLSTASSKLPTVSTFWQISDIHWDSKYSQLGSTKSQCHEKKGKINDENETSNNEERLGFFGTYGCDSPWTLVRSAVRAMKKIQDNPDFILWTGDNSPHSNGSRLNLTSILHNMKQVLQVLLETFPNSIIVPCLGNSDIFADHPQDKEFYQQVLSKAGWQQLLPHSTRMTFLKGGYYTFLLQPSLRIISLNTNLLIRTNTVLHPSNKLSDQLHWLDSVLRLAQGLKEKVLIVGHHPPGFQESDTSEPLYPNNYNNQYIQVVRRHIKTIKAQFFAHLHSDTFRLIENKQDEIVGTIFLSSSLSPGSFSSYHHPAIKLYQYDAMDVEILDYNHYILNLTMANKMAATDNLRDMQSYLLLGMEKQIEANWTLEYKATEAYGITNLTVTSLSQLYDSFLEPCSVSFDQYSQYFIGANQECNKTCKHLHLCAIRHLETKNFWDCLNKSTHSCSTTEASFKNVNIHVSEFQHLRLMDNESVSSTVDSNANPLLPSFNPHLLIIFLIIIVIIITITLVICIRRRRRRQGYGPRYFRAFGLS